MKQNLNKIQNSFTQSKNNSFIAYITAGDYPKNKSINYTVECALALLENNVDLLELGLPFTDPIADGPIIQAAHYRALDNNFKTDDILICLEKIRKHNNKPIILMGYANPIIQLINNNKLKALSDYGLDGILTVDMIPNNNINNNFYHDACINSDLSPIYIVTPNTDKNRLEIILNKAQNTNKPGFIYYAMRSGVTGFDNNNKNNFISENIANHIKHIKTKTKLPIAAGFGIKNKTMAKQTLSIADGFISGSYFVKAMADNISPEKLIKLAIDLDPR
jgi:tryptophan synthase alpha chain